MIASDARNDDYLVDRIDKAIAELVLPKYKLQKAYNYYNGKRDAEQYRYLEENFGIGSPTSVEFTPLIRKHIDALIGEYLDTPLLPKVSCKDKETISKISRDKELTINKEVYSYLRSHLNNSILRFLEGQDIVDKAVESQIQKLIADMDNNFVSDYEIAAQNVIEYIIQSRDTDLMQKLRTLLLDLLVTGTTYYRVKPSPDKNNLQIEVLNPLNTFVDRNPDSMYVKDSYRVVVRKWYTKQEILNKYGKDMDAEDIKELQELFEGYWDSSYIYVRSLANKETGAPLTDGLEAGKEVTPGFPLEYWETYNYKLLPVFEVEWVDVDKEGEDYVMNRYEGVRIGQEMYILTGKSQNVIRTKDNPTHCTLSVNGLFFINRNNEPYSLVLACAALQDRYDLVIYFRDNILANSGTLGDWVDVSMLPTFLGHDLTERMQKFLAYKKTGVAPIDTSQEGRAFNNNTSFAGFDDTIKVQTIQAFETVLERIENQTSSITGVFRERLNGIGEKDAVSNVKVGVQNSYTITKPYYQQMDLLSTDILIDSLNMAKIVWKKGCKGVLILGDKLQKVFTALPEKFTFTDYDVHIVPSSQIMSDMKTIQQVVVELIKSGQVEADVAIDAMTARSLTELKDKISKALKIRREESGELQQLQQQVEQLTQQLQQAQQQNQQLQSKVQSLDEARLQIERDKAQNDSEIMWYQARTERNYKSTQSDNDTKRTDIELMQLSDGNNQNDAVKNV